MTVADESNGFYYGFRRFIVVGNARGLSTCLSVFYPGSKQAPFMLKANKASRPISTYGQQGCRKRGVDASCHGQAYDDRSSRPPRLLDGEPELGVAPIAIKIDKDQDHEKIEKNSRINYSKFVSIEHNFPVLFIGRVKSADENTMSRAATRFFSQNTAAR
jgi:hypothetical protein